MPTLKRVSREVADTRKMSAEQKKHDKRLIAAIAMAWVVAEMSKDKASKSLRARVVHDFANAVIETGNQLR